MGRYFLKVVSRNWKERWWSRAVRSGEWRIQRQAQELCQQPPKNMHAVAEQRQSSACRDIPVSGPSCNKEPPPLQHAPLITLIGRGEYRLPCCPWDTRMMVIDGEPVKQQALRAEGCAAAAQSPSQHQDHRVITECESQGQSSNYGASETRNFEPDQ